MTLLEDADALRVISGAAEVRSLRAVGVIPGVRITHVSGLNGKGTGRIRSTGDGLSLSWRAPGSATYGTEVVVTAVHDGEVLLPDGVDSDKYVRVWVLGEHLATGPRDANVYLDDEWNNPVATDDVDAAEALAGDTETYTLTLRNDSALPVTDVLCWFDSGTDFVEVFSGTWQQPTTPGTAVTVSASIAAGATATLTLRRVIPAAQASDPRTLVRINLRHTYDGSDFDSELRGQHRIFNAAEYRFYRSTVAPPQAGDTPFDTNATLPHEPTDTFADGTWFLACSYFNGCIDSGLRPIGPQGETYLTLIVSGGAAQPELPLRPSLFQLQARPGGVVRVLGLYDESGANRADAWAIAYTTDGTSPAAGAPDVTAAIAAEGLAVLSHDLPAQDDGTLVRVRLQVRRGTTYSDPGDVLDLTVDRAGPTAPLSLTVWDGVLPEGV